MITRSQCDGRDKKLDNDRNSAAPDLLLAEPVLIVLPLRLSVALVAPVLEFALTRQIPPDHRHVPALRWPPPPTMISSP
jgi:hypothetical protein